MWFPLTTGDAAGTVYVTGSGAGVNTVTQCVMLCDVAKQTYGQLVAKRRTELDLSVRRAAEISGVSVTRWHDIERGGELRGGKVVPSRRPSYRKTVLKMARALEWSDTEALRYAGYHVPDERVPTPMAAKSVTPERVWELWPSLTPRLRKALTELVEAIADATGEQDEESGPGPATLHPHTIETPGEPVRSIDGQEGLIEPS